MMPTAMRIKPIVHRMPAPKMTPRIKRMAPSMIIRFASVRSLRRSCPAQGSWSSGFPDLEAIDLPRD